MGISKMEVIRMSQMMKNDLCTNCTFSKACTHRSGGAEAVHVCEEHHSEIVKKDNFNAAQILEYVDMALGLCLNCDHLTNCVLPEKGMKITQCEEYK